MIFILTQTKCFLRIDFFINRESSQPVMAPTDQVSSPVDPQREAARAKREHRRERDREHHRDSRGSGQRRTQRLERESSVPHESEYAISTKQQRSNKSRERSRGSRGGNENERPLSQHEMGNTSTTDLMMQNLEPCKFLYQITIR